MTLLILLLLMSGALGGALESPPGWPEACVWHLKTPPLGSGRALPHWWDSLGPLSRLSGLVFHCRLSHVTPGSSYPPNQTGVLAQKHPSRTRRGLPRATCRGQRRSPILLVTLPMKHPCTATTGACSCYRETARVRAEALARKEAGETRELASTLATAEAGPFTQAPLREPSPR